MADNLTPEQRSRTMSRIRRSDTAIERALVGLLDRLFPEEEVIRNATHLPGEPDAWLPGLRLAVFADGCFFHGCPRHFQPPKTNPGYWERKIRRNRRRDREVRKLLTAQGISVVRIWGHTLRNNPLRAKGPLIAAVSGRADDEPRE